MTLDEKAREFAKLHPKHNGGTWHLWCAALIARMCIAYGAGPIPIPPSAQIAGDWAGKLNLDSTVAPIGAFHYWKWGADGHVGLDTKGGGTDVFMASSFVREALGDGIGFQSVKAYTRPGINTYRGWGMLYGKNGKITLEVPMTAPKPAVISAPVLSVAQQEMIDQGIFIQPVDWTKQVDYNTLAWALHKLEHLKT